MNCSIIVLTYNTKSDSLEKTLNSIVNQTGIDSLEIIICDDGSDYFDEEGIINILAKLVNCNYKIIRNKLNQGTVKNLLSGVRVSNGRYIKPIGAGDILYNKNTVMNFVSEMDKNGLEVAFGLLYGQNKDGIQCNANYPKDIKSYILKDKEQVVNNIVALSAHPSGASLIYKRECLLKYLLQIEGKIIYCEDYIQAILVLDKINIGCIPQYIMYYEMGTGISTGGNTFWIEKMKCDYIALRKILLQKEPHNKYVLRGNKLQILRCREDVRSKVLKNILFIDIHMLNIKTLYQNIKGNYTDGGQNE